MAFFIVEIDDTNEKLPKAGMGLRHANVALVFAQAGIRAKVWWGGGTFLDVEEYRKRRGSGYESKPPVDAPFVVAKITE